MTKVAKHASQRLSTDTLRYRLFQIRLETLGHECGPDCLCWQKPEPESDLNDRLTLPFDRFQN